MKVYPDFKSVPDGVKCRPVDTSRGIYLWMKKELWLDCDTMKNGEVREI